MTTIFNISLEDLYDRCIYASIAHAISNLAHPFMSYEQSWDGMNYSFHYGSSRGTITFDFSDGVLVGAIRDEKSPRRSWYPERQAIALFDEAPEKAKTLAENEALQYLFDEVEGVTLPVATAGFWNEEDRIISGDTKEDFADHGGAGIALLTLPAEESKQYWQEQYSLSPDQIKCADILFQWKKSGKLALDAGRLHGIDPGAEGYPEFLESLSEIGFQV